MLMSRSTIAAALALATLSGCSSTLAQCKLDAVDKLPPDPLAINGHDVTNLVARLQTCRAQAAPDGGSP